MSKLKLMVVMGTRPEIIKLSEVVRKADGYFDLSIVHTGQNYDYELNRVFFDDLGIREPDRYLGVVGGRPGADDGERGLQVLRALRRRAARRGARAG